ncbi:hypothetical protein GCM10010989_08200 [Croceicoccus pelagius]|uniref:Uncharacterized protein n=1 Tax=Croceicoccus pelagius TaxID=1703341 RepID=A0A917DH52_9SPHN|nr:hypothetical protein GCM10010989_08200 [Croceicoccus pelagius]
MAQNGSVPSTRNDCGKRDSPVSGVAAAFGAGVGSLSDPVGWGSGSAPHPAMDRARHAAKKGLVEVMAKGLPDGERNGERPVLA